ncbi:MAG TPA: hypothetical protein DCY35_05375, partial [Prolixibacteraceae bacterium]|nr:hypothetical protein [Prolixibacteraceae bacterium]
YSGFLVPGIYSVTFTHNLTQGNDTLVYQIDNDALIDTGLFTGKNLEFNFTAIQRTKTNVSLINALEIGANVSFRMGPEDFYFNMAGQSEIVYIQSGTYILTASQAANSTFMVGVVEVIVTDKFETHEIPLTEGIEISGTLTYDGEGVVNQKVNFMELGSNATITVSSDDTGDYYAILMPGRQYEVVVNFTGFDEDPQLRAYRYYSLPKILNATQNVVNYPLNLERENYTIVLSGTVRFEANIASETHLTFIAEFGNYSTTANSIGEFSLALPPARYLLYAHQPFTGHVYLEEVYIDLEQESLDVQLGDGYRIYGTVYYDLNQKTNTILKFTSESHLVLSNTTDENGYYDLWLPAGKYTISSELIIPKGGISVPYEVNLEVEMNSDKQINLPLTMVEERIVFISYEPSQLVKVPGNTTVVYQFEVENTGNIRDTYDITAVGGTPDWTTVLSETKVTLDPEEGISLEVTVSIPKDARVDQNQLTLTAVSEKNHTIRHSNIMNIPLIQYYIFKIEPAAISPKFSGGNINSQFNVVNKGNGADKITLHIANNEDLAISGWSVQLGAPQGAELKNDARMLVNVSLSVGSTTSIPIYLKPISDMPSRQTRVLVVGYSQYDNNAMFSEYIVLKYPELQVTSQNLTISGFEISSEPMGDQLTNTGVMIAAVASALLIFYYARKRRWVR